MGACTLALSMSTPLQPQPQQQQFYGSQSRSSYPPDDRDRDRDRYSEDSDRHYHHHHSRDRSPSPDVPCCEECQKTRTGSSGGCPCRLYSKQRRTTLPKEGCRTCGCKGCNPLDKAMQERSGSPEGSQSDVPKLFVGQVPSDCSENRLRDVFAKYGRVTDVHILRYKDGKSRNCGFVTFENHRQARDAIDALNKKYTIPPRKYPLVVTYAGSKD